MAALASVLNAGVALAQNAAPAISEALSAAVTLQMAENYRECITIGLEGVDTNGNGQVDADEDAGFYAEVEAFCEEDLREEIIHAARLAVLDDRQAAAKAQIEATTTAIINGAKAQLEITH